MSLTDMLLENRIIFRSGPIVERTASIVIQQMLYLQSVKRHQDVNLYIISPGGLVDQKVESFVDQWGAEAATDAFTCAIGQPTCKTMDDAGIHVNIVGVQATTEGAIWALAGYYVNRDLEEME